MIELALIFAKHVPEDLLYEQLIDAVKEYSIIKNDKNKTLVQNAALMVVLNKLTEGRDVVELIKHGQQVSAVAERMGLNNETKN